jgi:hyperosmotically inducible protein
MLGRFEGLFFRMVIVSVLFLGLGELGMASIPKNQVQLPPNAQNPGLVEKVRHSLLMLPYYSVFDELAFTIDGSNVVLTGEVTRPILKSEAEKAVRDVSGVSNVTDKIEVLPLSKMDDSIRIATYRAIFSMPGFEKYADQTVSPIRIIVKNGNISLDGVVATNFDRTMAETAARRVPFAFSVTDNLAIG